MEEEYHSTPDVDALSGWLTRERALALVLIGVSAIAFYICYRRATVFCLCSRWPLALVVVASPAARLDRQTKRHSLAAIPTTGDENV